MNIAIIGGGAAGYFTAINIKESAPEISVTIFESSDRSLAKVAVSGGGRCNLTNTFAEVKSLDKVYPRGANLMKRAFKTFDHRNTKEWFEEHGVALTTQDDQCLFPKSQNSQEIIDTFVRLANEYDIEVKHSHKVLSIGKCDGGYDISFCDEKLSDRHFDAVVVTTGGSPTLGGLSILDSLNLSFAPPVPSLFTFNSTLHPSSRPPYHTHAPR